MTLNGIDISAYQAGINLAQVASDFVIVKATEGPTYTSPNFSAQASAAVATGKLLGLYHFATADDPVKQADYFVSQIKSYIGKAVLVLDFESNGLKLGSAGAKQFLDRVASQTSSKPLIYMSKSTCHSMDWSAVAPTYGLWVAQYANSSATGYQTSPWTDTTGYGAWKSPSIYQYSSTGNLTGWTGNLDLDIAYLDKAAWQALANTSSSNTNTINYPTKGETNMIFAYSADGQTGTFLFDGVNSLAFSGTNAKAAYDHYIGTYKAIMGKDIPTQHKTAAQFALWVQLYPVKYVQFK